MSGRRAERVRRRIVDGGVARGLVVDVDRVLMECFAAFTTVSKHPVLSIIETLILRPGVIAG